ncbi:MAG TPA: hypothetical protein VLC09_09755 [Polyangiaceae bacterium]|nr:hypothetical protein [Polyangiaceae bacterium]
MSDGSRGVTALHCPHRPPCPGCPRFAQDELPPGVGRLEQLAQDAGIALEHQTGRGPGHRHRVRLSVRQLAGRPRLGIFEAGSHRLVSIPQCVVHHPAIARLHVQLEDWLHAFGIPAYDERRHSGLLRAVQMAVERRSGRVQLVLVVRDHLGPASAVRRQLEPLLGELERHESGLCGVWLNAQPEPTNTLLGETFEHVFGARVLEDESGGARVFYPPSAFGQANPELHDRAVERIHRALGSKERIVEYHAGVGTIGLGLASRSQLTFNEVGPGSLEGLRLGLRAVGDAAGSARVLEGPADEHVEGLEGVEAAIVDPPRKGLSPRLLAGLAERGPETVAYLSCGLDSFLRDVEVLRAGGYEPRELVALGYFPYTEHIETLAILRRVRA